MDKNKLMEQLRKAIREVIQEELGKSSYDATKGISTTELRDKEGKLVGYIKHKNTDGGLVAGGRMGKKAVEKMEKTDETTITIPVAALPSYKKGQQPTVINPQTGEEEVVSDVSSWAKKADENKYSLPAGSMKPKEPVKSQSALEKRFGHLKPGESASLKGDPKKVTPARKKSMEDKAREMGQMDMFTLEEWIGMMEEAGVNLNELSPETLKSYINKAARSATANAHFAGRLAADPDIPGGGVQKAKAAKRLRGIHRATEKLPESYTLEEWMGMMEEAGYSLQENDPYRDRNPNPKPEPGEIPQGDGGMIGYRGIPRGPAPKPDPYRDRNPNPKPEPGEIPQGAGGYHIEERRRINKLSSKKK
jgi:hypothetical protein